MIHQSLHLHAKRFALPRQNKAYHLRAAKLQPLLQRTSRVVLFLPVQVQLVFPPAIVRLRAFEARPKNIRLASCTVWLFVIVIARLVPVSLTVVSRRASPSGFTPVSAALAHHVAVSLVSRCILYEKHFVSYVLTTGTTWRGAIRMGIVVPNFSP